MRIPTALLVLVALAPASAADDAAFVVIVNSANQSTQLDRKTLTDIFLKKQTHWKDDRAIQPVDQSKTSSVRRRFSEDGLGRSVAAVRTYWNQLVFSGRGVPPPELATDVDVVRYVASHDGAIGYVSASVDLKAVKPLPLR